MFSNSLILIKLCISNLWTVFTCVGVTHNSLPGNQPLRLAWGPVFPREVRNLTVAILLLAGSSMDAVMQIEESDAVNCVEWKRLLAESIDSVAEVIEL